MYCSIFWYILHVYLYHLSITGCINVASIPISLRGLIYLIIQKLKDYDYEEPNHCSFIWLQSYY